VDGVDKGNGQILLDDGSARRCRFCGRELDEGFLFCPFCGGRIGPRDHSQVRWYHTRYGIAFALVLLGPFALPLVWSNPRYSVATKTTVTILILVLTALLVYLLVAFWFWFVHQIQYLTNAY